MTLSGRRALITGGAGHLGRAMGEALAEMGAALALLDLEAESCNQVAKAITSAYDTEVLALACDLADEASLKQSASQAILGLGGLDILINCAAFVGTSELEGWAVPFAEQSPTTWRAALEVNLTAPFILTQACTTALSSSGRGSILNIGSIYGMLGPDMSLYQGTDMGNPAAYAASKGGLLQFTRYLATVLAPRVRVNCITLGGVSRGQPANFTDRYIKRTPLGRMAIEDDIKGAALYLASDMSAYVTGTNLVVDGGFTAW